MLAAVDVLKAVEERGAASLDELDAVIPCPADTDDGFWTALDAAVDYGFLHVVGHKRGGEGCYRLTARGRRALQASADGTAAA